MSSALLSVVFFATLAYYGVLEVMDEIAMNAMTEAIELPMWWFTIAMPICSVLIILRVVARLRVVFQTGHLKKGKRLCRLFFHDAVFDHGALSSRFFRVPIAVSLGFATTGNFCVGP